MSETEQVETRPTCDDCGAPSLMPGGWGECFTVCEACWDKRFSRSPAAVPEAPSREGVAYLVEWRHGEKDAWKANADPYLVRALAEERIRVAKWSARPEAEFRIVPLFREPVASERETIEQIAADKLAFAVYRCVGKVLDARSEPADALLDYVQTRFNLHEPSKGLEMLVEMFARPASKEAKDG